MDIKEVLLPFFQSFATHKGTGINSENKQLAEKLQKLIIRNFLKHTVYSSFKENIWDAILPDMQLIKNCNKGIRFLLCDMEVCSKHTWVVSSKIKKKLQLLKLFKNFR